MGGIVKLHGPTVYGAVSGNQLVQFDQYGTVNGAVKYGTTYSPGTTTVSGPATQGTTALPLSFATEQGSLTALSTTLKNLSASGTVTYQYGAVKLVGTSLTRNVFHVSGSQLNNCNSFQVQAPAGATVVVNVDGTSDRMQNFGFTYTGATRNYVLFNFHQATTFSLSGIGVEGSVTTTYGYDLFGRRTSIVSPTGTIGYGYDVAGNRVSMTLPSGTVGYEFDALDRMSAVVHPDGARTRYIYDVVGNRASKILPGGLTTTYGYDTGNRLIAVNNPVGSSFTYTLDASGKRISVVDSLLGATNYSYDGLGRLTGESGPAGDIGYAYDAVGNRLSKTTNGVSVGYSYDDDRMLTEGSKSFGYDNNGNTLSADGQSLTYDFENHLIATTGGASGPTQYVYDASGNRLQRLASGTVTSYLTDPLGGYGNVVEERSGFTGSLVARYDYGVDLARMDRVGVGGSRYYLHDGLGSVVGLADGAGQLTDRWGYDAYGNPSHLEGSTLNPFLFNGQQWDEAEGLYFNRARYYAPQQGRFLTHDPLMGGSGDPQSLHRYLYANADPVNFSDPTGMFSLAEEMEVAGMSGPVRQVASIVEGATTGSLFGEIYAWGKASILGSSPEETLNFVQQGGLWGAIIGGGSAGIGGLLARIPGAPCALNEFATGFGLGADTAAVAEDLGNFAGTGESKYAIAAAYDAAWGIFGLTMGKVGCFTEDAQVRFFSGASPAVHSGSIKELVSAWQSGTDVRVRTRDEATGQEEIRPVTNAWERTVTDVVTLELADAKTGDVVEVLTGTLEHPFMTPQGWVGMGSLGIGTEILTRAGPRLVVKSVRQRHFSDGLKVYNFTVDGKHTYFVGSAFGGSWVHNQDCEETPVYDDEGYTKHGQSEGTRGGQSTGKAPTNGPATLRNSVQYSPDLDGRQGGRVGVDPDTKEIVVLMNNGVREGQAPKYHGHVRTWDELSQAMKNALIRAGLAKPNGKLTGRTIPE